MNFECRRLQESDLPALIQFFRQCYGPETVFQDPDFIRWYLAGAPDGGLESLVAVSDTDAVVAHYGGLPTILQLGGRAVPMVWGVNAYTLPDWRGRGIGQRLVEMMMDRYDVFGVIGFTPKTADFYHAAGFNVFGKLRFHRFALALRPSIYEIAQLIGVDPILAEARFPLAVPTQSTSDADDARIQPLEIAGDHFCAPRLAVGAATQRDARFIAQRFLRNPFIRYAGFQMEAEGDTSSYVVTRSERLFPTENHALRIIDLRATSEQAKPLLQAVVRQGIAEGASYLDFACAGTVFDLAFAELDFTRLEEDQAALLPQVTAPVEARPNQEFVGLFSRPHRDEIAALTADDIYFTRADSDRDRIARLSQRTAA